MIAQVLADSDSGYSAADYVLSALFWIFLFCCYWIPTIVAAVRRVPNVGSVAVINFFLGWTIIGWVVALAMAARSTT
jgi:hypothetical protein